MEKVFVSSDDGLLAAGGNAPRANPQAARSPVELASSPSGDESNLLHFCKLGCAYSLCTTLSVEETPVSDEEKVAACADGCSKACIKDHKAQLL